MGRGTFGLELASIVHVCDCAEALETMHTTYVSTRNCFARPYFFGKVERTLSDLACNSLINSQDCEESDRMIRASTRRHVLQSKTRQEQIRKSGTIRSYPENAERCDTDTNYSSGPSLCATMSAYMSRNLWNSSGSPVSSSIVWSSPVSSPLDECGPSLSSSVYEYGESLREVVVAPVAV
jgi:hypothetical protein